jgi:hypothetical protein
VESVLTQCGPAVRVLIIDDASPDNTPEVAADLAAEDSRVTSYRHQTNKGHIATYNEGIEWASAHYMLILSADDYLLPGALSLSARLMDEHRKVGFTFGKTIVVDDWGSKKCGGTGGAAGGGSYILSGLEFIERSQARNIVPAPTAVIRTELQKLVGGYRPELPHTGDMEMWLRLAAHASVGVMNAYQAAYRRHRSNMSLVYEGDGYLPCLRQREAALKCFFQACTFIPDAPEVRRRVFWSLGCDAVGLASSAVNDGKVGVSQRVAEFALEVCPGIARSWPWLKLACKWRMPGVWRAVQPVILRLRRMLERG